MADVNLKNLLEDHLHGLIPKNVIVRAKICESYFNYCDPEDFDKLDKIIKRNAASSLGDFIINVSAASWSNWSLFPDLTLSNWVFPVFTEGVKHLTTILKLDISDWLAQQDDMLVQRLAALSFNIWRPECDTDYKARFSNNELISFLPHEDKVKLIQKRLRHQGSESKFYSKLNRNHLIWG